MTKRMTTKQAEIIKIKNKAIMVPFFRRALMMSDATKEAARASYPSAVGQDAGAEIFGPGAFSCARLQLSLAR
jgi:hypothetical protein